MVAVIAVIAIVAVIAAIAIVAVITAIAVTVAVFGAQVWLCPSLLFLYERVLELTLHSMEKVS